MQQYPSKEDDDILRALIHQVSQAVPVGGNEQDVVTFISKPMWDAWCRSAGIPKDAPPSEWNKKDCNRVYGSQTVVIPSQSMWSISKARS